MAVRNSKSPSPPSDTLASTCTKDGDELTVGEVDEAGDDHVKSNDSHVTCNGTIAETVRQSSRQKLAGLAFKADSEP